MDIFESLENLPVSEECFEDIIGLVEELILERNIYNKDKKRAWELRRTAPEPEVFGNDNKEDNVNTRQNAIKKLKDDKGPYYNDAVDYAVDALAHANRVSLGREADNVSAVRSYEGGKNNKRSRKVLSQRGSRKDYWAHTGDPLDKPV